MEPDATITTINKIAPIVQANDSRFHRHRLSKLFQFSSCSFHNLTLAIPCTSNLALSSNYFFYDFVFSVVSHLCYGSCKAVEHIGKGLCNVLDVAVAFLKATEMACNWVSKAINFILTQLFRIHR